MKYLDKIILKRLTFSLNFNNGYNTLFQVSLNKIPNTVKFEVDPNLDFSVRTKDNLPSNTIIGKPIDFNIIEKYNNIVKNSSNRNAQRKSIYAI